MKKSFAIICALLSLAACNKVTPIEENPTQKESGQEFKVNLTFSRSNISEDTKASVKTSFASGDVVFIFFNGVGDSTNPKYLEMKYNGSTWVPTQKNDLGASDLSGAGTKELTAIYLPYGSGYEVAYDGGFTIKDDSGNDYSGHFYAHHVGYTFTSNTLGADVNLSAVTSVGDKLVHFDVTDFVDGHTYAMYQEYIKPISLSSISADGIVNKNVGSKGDAIQGYQDASFISFSGVLDNTVVGSPVDYWFSIRDTFDGTLYYRDAGSQTISANKYIGLGSFASKWSVATPGVFTASASGERITFARSNLSYRGATGGGKPWQLMKYPWSVIETTSPFNRTSSVDFSLFGWATSGYNSKYPWFNSNQPVDYGPAISSGEFAPSWDWGQYNKGNIYEYGGDVALSGNWRVLSQPEWLYILGVTSTETNCGRNETNRFARCVVGGLYGVAIFPDDFDFPSGFPTVQEINKYTSGKSATVAFEQNTFTSIQWNMLEAMGVAFLPCAGQGNPSSDSTYAGLTNYNTAVRIWTSTASNSEQAYGILIGNASANALKTNNRHMAASVRLVRDL
ncbi:MAG: hypothetical protein IJP81_00065 [Bacteroidales bacterium]|nr:hypothetical protein [Bacteroidales bacterium]